MLQQSRPSIFRLPDPVKPAHRNPPSDMISGPISPLERNPQSTKGWYIRESDGIGLGIVAALDRSDGHKRSEKIVDTQIIHVSAPVCIGSPRAEMACNIWRCGGGASVDCHRPKDGGPFCGSQRTMTDYLRAFRPADFLSYCYLCRKRLDGKDIYMYGGEKAFCSIECRCQQISTDEFQEKCGSEAQRSTDVSRSSYDGDHRLFFMGIATS